MWLKRIFINFYHIIYGMVRLPPTQEKIIFIWKLWRCISSSWTISYISNYSIWIQINQTNYIFGFVCGYNCNSIVTTCNQKARESVFFLLAQNQLGTIKSLGLDQNGLTSKHYQICGPIHSTSQQSPIRLKLSRSPQLYLTAICTTYITYEVRQTK